MSSKLQQVGLVVSGLVAGILVSLHFSASAGKEAATASLPIEELRSFADVYNAIKQGYVEPVEDKKLITHAISGMLGSFTVTAWSLPFTFRFRVGMKGSNEWTGDARSRPGAEAGPLQ